MPSVLPLCLCVKFFLSALACLVYQVATIQSLGAMAQTLELLILALLIVAIRIVVTPIVVTPIVATRNAAIRDAALIAALPIEVRAVTRVVRILAQIEVRISVPISVRIEVQIAAQFVARIGAPVAVVTRSRIPVSPPASPVHDVHSRAVAA